MATQQILALLKRATDAMMPPPQWRLPVLVLGGIICGLGLHVLHISRAFSYLSDEPAVCMNCHVMTTQYATWERGNHGKVATCNDCHVPHTSLPRKYAFKAMDGLRHSTIFTLRLEPQVIRIKEAGSAVVQENCLRCHSRTVHEVRIEPDDRCWHCHRTTPHGRGRNLASTPFARVPRLSNPVPEWLDAMMKSEEEDSTSCKETTP